MPKRKNDALAENGANTKMQRRAKHNGSLQSNEYWKSHFGRDLFVESNILDTKLRYLNSTPYNHGVIENLINDKLLRGVREEVLSEIHYTQKETDIYKIHQSGDLANLDGLDDASLAKLPNLLKLRDALYSPVFREFLENVTRCGKLSGRKTDMAINVYTPGSQLLCHDDVIGSRRISYILYLTDPDEPWREEWGGALRLFPTRKNIDSNGKASHIPLPDPGFSFHDVGEVFENLDEPRSHQPTRVAISGWFHIPQPGEIGFLEGEAETLQKQSSLTTLQSSDEKFDFPRPRPVPYPEYDAAFLRDIKFKDLNTRMSTAEDEQSRLELLNKKALVECYQAGEGDPDFDVLTEAEAGFLCEFINPQFLTPDQAEAMSSSFTDNGHLVIEQFLHPKFAKALEHYIDNHFPRMMPYDSKMIEMEGIWTVAKPPHKHRYLIMNETSEPLLSSSPESRTATNEVGRLLNKVFRSSPFRKWLQIVTGLVLKSHDTRIRRFRRGQDYQLAKLYKEPDARVEITLGLSPHGNWELTGSEEDQMRTGLASEITHGINGKSSKRKRRNIIEFEPLSTEPLSEETNNGGYEMFIRGDEDEDDALGDRQNQPQVGKHSHLDVSGKQNRKKADPAIYKAVDGDEDDGILLNLASSFNRLGIVLRDKGSMRFVKYVSRRAGYDRWDLAGEFEIDWARSAKVHGWDEDGSSEPREEDAAGPDSMEGEEDHEGLSEEEDPGDDRAD